MNKQYDFVAIGDVVVDAFIRLQDAHVTCTLDNTKCELCMKYGSKVPFEYAKILAGVGNSANAAVSASRLGLSAALVAPTGDDQNGQLCIDTLAQDGVGTEYINRQSLPTNYHYVLWYGDERTILIKHEKYAYKMVDVGTPKYIYLSSLGEDASHLHGEIVEYLKAHPESKLAFQPGTFQIKMGTEALRDLYTHTDTFICNLEEAQEITKLSTREVRELAQAIMNLGPKVVLVTDGHNGAYSFDGTEMVFMPPYPDPAPPLERTGAGDAFASTFVTFLALGMSPEEALRRAPINSMSVVQHIGAQEGLLAREALEKYLADAPADYVAKKM